ncbi:PQQ-binding-like beta-propeller repeat protein [Actinomadura xylanilytica]|uniref:outer membrane protein assembly factor BamB family protein n=1 Tax=Actinomadura xylanilytica TaxID=887459 RepID=UPI00255AA82A|nr:PQQ-binding-like beta-propeller repeat protein [Actinomadura xylanilytica]MDL4775711.1 PQQ-binding-like beta-propeller repeat protein [Actinomadura xylanilytica]
MHGAVGIGRPAGDRRLPAARTFAGTTLYVGAGQRLDAYRMNRDRPLWSATLPDRIVGTPVAGRSAVYVSTERGLTAFGPADGRRLWAAANPARKDPTGGWLPKAVGPFVYVTGLQDTLHAFEGRSGRPMWTFQAGGGLTADPSSDPRVLTPLMEGSGPIVFNGADQLSAVGAGDGRATWQKPIEDPSDLFAASAGARVHLATKGGVLSFHPASGEIVQHVDDLRAESLSTADDVVYFAGGPRDADRPTTVYAMNPPPL